MSMSHRYSNIFAVLFGISCLIMSIICIHVAFSTPPLLSTLPLDSQQMKDLFAPNPVQDFGEIRQGKILSADFVLSNHSSEIIQILEIRAGCDCTNHKVAKKEIKPGESTNLVCQWKTDSKHGKSVSDIMIFYRSGDFNKKTLMVRMTAHVKPEYSHLPEYLSFNLSVQEQEVKFINFYAEELKDFKIIDVHSTHRAFSPTIVTGKPQVAISFDPKLWGGENSSAFLVVSTNSKVEPERKINLMLDSSNDPQLIPNR